MVIRLTPMGVEDLKKFNSLRNQVAVKFLHDPRKFTDDECSTWWWNYKGNYHYYNILNIDERTNTVNWVGYFRLNQYEPNYILQVGADLIKEARGKGIAERAYRELESIVKKYLPKISRLRLEVLHSNRRARGFYEKLGFIYEGSTVISREGKKEELSHIMIKDI